MLTVATLPMGMYQTNCYIVSDEKNNCVIFDCDGNQDVEKYVEKNNLTPKYIFLTHGHSDHISGVEILRKKYNCQVVASEKEEKLLLNPELNLSASYGMNKTVNSDILVKEGSSLTAGDIEIKTIETPGHTAGSVCYIVGDDIMITGDTLFEGACGRFDLPTGDVVHIRKSLLKLKNLDSDFKVFPGHGGSTTLEKERQTNPYMKNL